ncbi:MAG: NAD-dependent epimerase/dehydratase family protein [Elusimicrobiota bacterium]
MANILVTGGTGFIGSHLVQKLLDMGNDVVVVSHGTRKLPSSSRLEVLTFDLRNQDDCVKNLRGFKFHKIFNLSGYIDHTPFLKGGDQVLSQHFQAVQNIVKSCDRSELKSFVQIGSSDEYGNAIAPQKELDRELPISPYSVGKVAASHFLQMLHRTEAYPAVVVRLFLVYGPGQDQKRFLPQIIKGCLANSSFPSSEGKQLRDFCYIDDIVNGLITSSDTEAAKGEILNLASGIAISIREVVENVMRQTHGGNPQWGKIPYRSGENMGLYADISKVKRILNWVPSISLDEGIKKTIEFYRVS